MSTSHVRRDPFNWISPKVTVRDLENRGKGLVATDSIFADERVLVYGGIVITLQEFQCLSARMQNYPIQIDHDLFLAPAEQIPFGPSEYLNHSCEPTCGFSSGWDSFSSRDPPSGRTTRMEQTV